MPPTMMEAHHTASMDQETPLPCIQNDIDHEEEEPLPMADALMRRGEFLRKLRAMELEAEREEEEQQPQEEEDVIYTLKNGRRVLLYDSFLGHQRYYDDLKHVDCHYIDYGNVGGSEDCCGRLVIEQDKRLGKGGLCWDAAFILAEHLMEHKEEWMSKSASALVDKKKKTTASLVELGSGTGLCGLMIAKAMEECHVRITDLPELLPFMTRNVQRNFESSHIVEDEKQMKDDENNDDDDMKEVLLHTSHETNNTAANPRQSRGTVCANVLRWGVPEDYQQHYDVVVGADVVASLYDPIALAETMHALCHDESIVYVSYKGRLTGPHEQFEQRLGHLFDTVERIRPSSRNKNSQVWILKATGKR